MYWLFHLLILYDQQPQLYLSPQDYAVDDFHYLLHGRLVRLFLFEYLILIWDFLFVWYDLKQGGTHFYEEQSFLINTLVISGFIFDRFFHIAAEIITTTNSKLNYYELE